MFLFLVDARVRVCNFVVANNEVKMTCMHQRAGLIGANRGDNNRRLVQQPVSSVILLSGHTSSSQ